MFITLLPYFGQRFLSAIRPKHIEDYKQMRAKVAAFTTVNLELQQLGTILGSAVTWGYLKDNPAREVKRLRIPEREPTYLTREQIALLYPQCYDWLHTFVAIALNTGMRVSEVLALEWEDVDIATRVIKVRSDEDFTTKGRRNRELPVNGFLLHVLKKAPRHISFPHILFTSNGRSPSDADVRQRFYYAVKQANLPHFRVHDLRHTFGTHLVANGVDIRTIQELMGHTDLKTTMKYLHAAPNRMRGAVENLNLDGTTQEEKDERAKGQGEVGNQTGSA